ncbi:MAG: PKD domain-containing protein [Methanoculleus sp.]|nr:PKD domain-containing protein [Methanoculleus sp.]
MTIVSPVSGSSTEIGLPVRFSATATGAGLTYLWETGDGGSVTGQDVNYTYGKAGNYTVNLTVSNEYGASSAQADIAVTKPDPILFNTSVTVYADEPIVVDNVSYGGNTFFNILAAAGYTYTYGDSDSGYSDRKPLLTLTIDGVTYPTRDFGADYKWKFYETIGTGNDNKYKKALNGYIDGSGTYYIWFGDTSQFGSWDLPTIDNSIYVVALTVDLQPTRPGTLPVADFTANVTSGDAPLAVAFTDASSNTPTSWSWDFGDGATSDEQNPVHTYTAAGTYTVNLTVANAAGSDSATQTIAVTTAPVTPVAGFAANVTSGNVPLVVRFTDTSTGSPTAWSWTFGDGNISAGQNPVHTYTVPGIYTVTLTVTNAAGSSSATGVVTVQEIPAAPPEAEKNFTLDNGAVNVTTGEGGQQVTFNATAGTGNVTGNDILLQSGGLNVTIRTDGLTTNGSVSTGNVTGVHLESAPVNATVGNAGNVSVSFAAEMNGYNPALGITASIYDQPGDTANTAFVLAAKDENLEIAGIAYAVYFTKTNLTGNDTIYDAVLRLTASPAWVDANGGVDAVRIFRLGDDGTREVLNTTYEGMENGMMVFEAVSPKGFSAFAVVATAAASSSSSVPSSSGGGGGSSTSVGAASNLEPGETVTLAMDTTAVSAITLTANDTVKDVMVTVAKGSLPQAAEPPAGTIYQYIRATLYKAAEADLSAVQFRFAVPATWLAENGCTAEQVTLFRYADGAWQAVPVEALGEENGNAIFSAASGGFGLFAIAATGEIPDVTGEATPQPTGTEAAPTADVTVSPAKPPVEEPPAGGLPVTPIVFIAGAVIVIAAAGYFLVKRK